MRVAIAVNANEVAPHFGRCEYYELVDVEEGEAVERECLLSPGHGQPGELPRLMQQHRVDCVVCGGAGARAQQLFAELGIEFMLGVSGVLDEIIPALAAGELETGEGDCLHNQ